MYEPAPFVLNDTDQSLFAAQLLCLIRSYYGEKAQYALSVVVPVIKEDEPTGAAFYASGSTDEPEVIRALFNMGAEQMRHAEIRKIAIEDGEPGGAKN